jgi:co-chaperonin GroES (HSP10)
MNMPTEARPFPLVPPKGRIIILHKPKDTVTASGLVLAHRKELLADHGVVLAVGPEVAGVDVGDEVVFREGASTAFQYGEDWFHSVRDADLHAVVTL